MTSPDLSTTTPARATWNRQQPSPMPSHRYRDVFARVEVPLTDRRWPQARLTQAPLWVPVDLRDGNQALAEPMSPERKRRFFKLMVAMGYKEIEVGYPSASQTDYDFVRLLAETDLAPDDVTIVVFTPARRDLIERTVESLRGLRRPAVIHLYTATAPIWRDVVLGHDRATLRDLILGGARDVLELAGDLDDVRFEFSPEVFNLTEPDFALEVCNAVTTTWDASPQRPVILNLPATVEVATPNVYADQIEYMDRHLERRDSVILSVHPHNDRGTGVACAELAVLAGAQRVEGCLFGNGERTGNVDLVTLALNLHAQGVDPRIDLSDIDEVRRVVEECNRIPVHPRHPYVGDLVHTAFSGTHQDAIRKGFAEHRARAAAQGHPESEIAWQVPYLPIDPADLGRTYEAVIRVNSQSGKGGIAYLLERDHGIELPRRLQVEFARHVQRHTDADGGEATAAQVYDLFRDAYLPHPGEPTPIVLEAFEASAEATSITLLVEGRSHRSRHHGIGPVEALIAALAEHGVLLEVVSLHQSSLATGVSADALTLVEYRSGEVTGWAAGTDRSVVTATLSALMHAATALNR
ncbi:2-isopropylmalate synthase [Nocardioides sp.]|uniref:2-isopropylmalate synthase n=1 Tax=Nocardioides sp. TaxID=35761 RepID=UPI002609E3FD|nr:2-isopropylmalate synthase [Nocardioides sp.]